MDHPEVWQQRGRVRAVLHQWDGATADLVKAVDGSPERVEPRSDYTLLRLATGHTADYRRGCAALLERFGEEEDLDAAETAAWTCVLAPDAVGDPAQVVKVAKRIVAEAPTSYAAVRTLGATLYRAGRPESAVQRLTEAAALQEDAPSAWLFLAMAHGRLGHEGEARDWLEKASRWIEQATKDGAGKVATSDPVTWQESLEFQILRREAEALLKKPSGGNIPQ